MINLLRLEKGVQTLCPDDNTELINGVEYRKEELTEAEKDIVRNLHAMGAKIVLTKRPLDILATPQESLAVPNMENTILRPEIAMTMKDTDFPAWVVEIVQSHQEEAAYLIKPNLYMKAGVKQYWIIDSRRQVILDYHFEEDGLIPYIYDAPRRIKLIMYKETFLSYTDIFKSRDSEKAAE